MRTLLKPPSLEVSQREPGHQGSAALVGRKVTCQAEASSFPAAFPTPPTPREAPHPLLMSLKEMFFRPLAFLQSGLPPSHLPAAECTLRSCWLLLVISLALASCLSLDQGTKQVSCEDYEKGRHFPLILPLQECVLFVQPIINNFVRI